MTKKDSQVRWCDLYVVTMSLLYEVRTKLSDFESKIYRKKIVKDLYNIDHVYMQSILLDLAKILGSTQSDHTGMDTIRKHTRNSVTRDLIDKFVTKHSKIISKIRTNRNSLISHINLGKDFPFYKLGFSGHAIRGMINDQKMFMKHQGSNPNSAQFQAITDRLKAMKKNHELQIYTISDFHRDGTSFKIMIDAVESIITRINQEVHPG